MPNSGKIATILGNVLTDSQIDLSTKADLVDGKIPSSQLPSYVDDILEYANLAAFPATGSTGIIYVAQDTNKIYRWGGSSYTEISPSPGSTDSVPEGSTNLYFTNTRARAAITLTTTGTSGAATYSSGVLNIPQYQSVLSNPITGSGAGNSGEIVYFTGSTSVGGTAAFAWSSPTMTIGLSAASNETDYKVLIQRHGTLANPGTWTDSNGLQIVDYAADGPSVGFIATGLVSIELPRIATTDTYAGNAVALRVATDNMTVLAVKGNGTVHLGQNGSVDSGDRFQVNGSSKFSGFITAGSSDGNGLRIYGSSGTNQWDMYLNSTNLRFSDNTGTGSVVFDRPISGTSATFTGNISAANFSGSSSGTNTGDQNISILAPNAASFGDANAITTGGFFAAFNPSNIPSGQTSGDWGVLSQPLWTSNSSGERYTLQFAANLDSNANIFVRKFRYNGSVLQSAWYTLLNSSNYSAYTGSGTSGRLSKWTASGISLNDSSITDNGTIVRINTLPLLADSRLAVGTAGGDQNYASIFIGGAITNGTSQYALLCDPQLAGSSANYAVFANARIKANTAVASAFGVYIPSAEKLSGATITDNYALYIANQTSGSTTNYSIYSSGGRNYFGDKVSIGSNTFFTVAQFLVNGGLNSASSAIAQFNGFLRIKDQLIIHNDANTGLESYLQCTAANEITTLNLRTSNIYASGNLVTIGNWNSSTTLQFQSSSNAVGRINFYDANDTEGVYIRNTGESYGGTLRFGARWDDDEDKIFFKLYQSSAGAAYDARFGINVDPTETFQVSSNGVTAGAPSKGWPVYDAELDTQARRFMFQTAGNNGIATAGYGGTVALVLGQYYDSRVVITPQSNGGASPGDQGTGHGKDLMIKGGTSDNGVGYKGGRLYLNGGMGYTAGGYNGNFGTVKIQTYGGVVNIGEITGETRRLNVAYSIGIRANLTGTEQEIIRMGNTGSGVNDGYLALLDSGTTKVLLGANASRSGDNFINNGGNFGINTDVPTNKLEVFSGSTTADALTLSFTTGADNRYTGIFFKGGPYPYARIVGGTSSYGPDQGFIAFYTNYNPSGAASTSGYCLERVRINPNGSIVATGDITAFGSPSDIRLKDIKEVVPNALESIMKITAYRFDWKEVNHLTKIKEDIGVIAQEVEKVLPELARTNDDGTMSVRYQGLTAVLIEAVKELAAENNKLKEILKRNNII